MKEKWILEFQGNVHNEVSRLSLNELSLNEDYIIQQSQEKYGTDEPCIIYRTCILNDKLFLLKNYIHEIFGQGKEIINIRDIPLSVSEGLELMNEYRFLKITKETKRNARKNLFRQWGNNKNLS